jgi:hypothetical protein
MLWRLGGGLHGQILCAIEPSFALPQGATEHLVVALIENSPTVVVDRPQFEFFQWRMVNGKPFPVRSPTDRRKLQPKWATSAVDFRLRAMIRENNTLQRVLKRARF